MGTTRESVPESQWVLVFFPLLLSVSVKAASNPFVCVPGLLMHGATSPKGDIILKEGDTLEVNCTIDVSSYRIQGLSSKEIEFSFAKHIIPDDRLHTKIIDNATLMLRVENMNISKPLLMCSLRHPDNTTTPICENQIEVGYLPQPPTSLRCLARGWASLNCTWTKPDNPILTNYEIGFLFSTSAGTHLMRCPNQINLSNITQSCEWTERTDPTYRPNRSEIRIVINGTNQLQPNGVLWNYSIKHWEIVIPQKPKKIESHALSWNEVQVRWTFGHFEHFAPGLFHQVKLCPSNELEAICTVRNFSSKNFTNLTRVIEVPYAFTPYRLEVRMRSQAANDTEEFWSPPAVAEEIWTKSKKPDVPPRTSLGSFEIKNMYQLRDVTVFWQGVPVLSRNGSDFHYKVTASEDGGRGFRSDQQLTTTASFVIFSNLSLSSHRFEIRSVNSEGSSDETSVISVPSSSQAPKGPTSVSKLDYSNGTYEISWQHPNSIFPNAVSYYTVYRCLGKHSQCSELLDWVDVGLEKTSYVFRDLPFSEATRYVFAVSANTDNMSSGMVIATCELINDKEPGKLTDVRQTRVTSDTIEIKWRLDCSYRPDLIQRFRITYCQILASTAECIREGTKNETAPAEATFHTIHNLKPFSTYSIWISILTRVGESQLSDPLYVNTTEAAPSDSPTVESSETTNVSAIFLIKPPKIPNGVIQTYKLIYETMDMPQSTPNELFVDAKDLYKNPAIPKDFYYKISGLEANANYSLRLAAYTTSWSNLSKPVYFTTKLGYTKLRNKPNLNFDRSIIVVSWDTPSHIGGPIEYFEVLVKRDGVIMDSEGNTRKIYFVDGQRGYSEKLQLSCESNTNVTAQIRAISKVDEKELYGTWSPEGIVNCVGFMVWYYWVLIVILSFIAMCIVGFAVLQGYRKYKIMDLIHIDEPPGVGMDDPFGIPMSECNKRSRQTSDGDTYSYCKENLPYQAHSISSNNGDETKDFLSSDSGKEFGKSGQDSPTLTDPGNMVIPFDDSSSGPLLFGNTNDPIWLWQAQIIQEGDHEAGLNRVKELPQVSQLPLPKSTVTDISPGPESTDELLVERQISPPPSPIHDHLVCGCAEGGNLLEHYKSVANHRHTDDPICNGHCRCRRDSEPDESFLSPVTVDIALPLISDSSSSVDSNHESHIDTSSEEGAAPPALQSTSSQSQPGPSNPATSNPYVKWTELKSDPVMNGHNGKPPYCKVSPLKARGALRCNQDCRV